MSQETAHSESGEGAESAEHQATESSVVPHDDSSERVLGINLESNLVLVVVGVFSLGLTAASLTLTAKAVLGVTIVFASGAAIFDIAEIAHQADASRVRLAALAAVVAALHLVAVGAAVIARRSFVATTAPLGSPDA